MADMLKSYSLDFKGKKNGEKDYELNFKVANGVGIEFQTDGDIQKIQLRWNSGTDAPKKNYKVKGPLKVQFFQHPALGAGKDGPDPGPPGPDPDIQIEP